MTKDQFTNAYERVYDLSHGTVRELTADISISSVVRGIHAILLLQKEGVPIDDWECYLAPYLFRE